MGNTHTVPYVLTYVSTLFLLLSPLLPFSYCFNTKVRRKENQWNKNRSDTYLQNITDNVQHYMASQLRRPQVSNADYFSNKFMVIYSKTVSPVGTFISPFMHFFLFLCIDFLLYSVQLFSSLDVPYWQLSVYEQYFFLKFCNKSA